MESEAPAGQELAHLRALAAELEAAGLRTELHRTGRRSPRLCVTSSQRPALAEDITCHQPTGRPWQFYWSSRQPIAAASEPAAAASAIAAVLRPVSGPSPAAAPGPGRVPGDPFDQTAPNAARIYDYLLGGEQSYDVDRQAARRLLLAVPQARQAARDNRAWLGRVVRCLASEGISQFIDIGSGLPAAGPVHEAAWQVNPDARIAYIDHDPVAAGHARALLGSLPPGRAGQVAASEADLRCPRDLMTSRQLRDVISLDRPAAVILSAVLHFIPDDAGPAGILSAITSRLAPGSALAVSHGTADFITPDAELAARAAWAAASAPAIPRTGTQLAGLLSSLDLIEPGLTDIRDWRPDPGPRGPGPLLLYAAAGHIRQP